MKGRGTIETLTSIVISSNNGVHVLEVQSTSIKIQGVTSQFGITTTKLSQEVQILTRASPCTHTRSSSSSQTDKGMTSIRTTDVISRMTENEAVTCEVVM